MLHLQHLVTTSSLRNWWGKWWLCKNRKTPQSFSKSLWLIFRSNPDILSTVNATFKVQYRVQMIKSRGTPYCRWSTNTNETQNKQAHLQRTVPTSMSTSQNNMIFLYEWEKKLMYCEWQTTQRSQFNLLNKNRRFCTTGHALVSVYILSVVKQKT